MRPPNQEQVEAAAVEALVRPRLAALEAKGGVLMARSVKLDESDQPVIIYHVAMPKLTGLVTVRCELGRNL